MGRYRWLVLADGVLAQAALSAFHQGLPGSAGFALVCALAFGGWLLLSPLMRQERAGWLAPA